MERVRFPFILFRLLYKLWIASFCSTLSFLKLMDFSFGAFLFRHIRILTGLAILSSNLDSYTVEKR